jgi:hypothetical protein
MTLDEVLHVAAMGVQQGSAEILFTLGKYFIFPVHPVAKYSLFSLSAGNHTRAQYNTSCRSNSCPYSKQFYWGQCRKEAVQKGGVLRQAYHQIC